MKIDHNANRAKIIAWLEAGGGQEATSIEGVIDEAWKSSLPIYVGPRRMSECLQDVWRKHRSEIRGWLDDNQEGFRDEHIGLTTLVWRANDHFPFWVSPTCIKACLPSRWQDWLDYRALRSYRAPKPRRDRGPLLPGIGG